MAEENIARIAKRFDPPFVGNLVAELDDFGDATEMFDKARSAAKRLASKVVNGDLSVV